MQLILEEMKTIKKMSQFKNLSKMLGSMELKFNLHSTFQKEPCTVTANLEGFLTAEFAEKFTTKNPTSGSYSKKTTAPKNRNALAVASN